MELAKAVYDLTSSFPLEERYGLSQQMRRAAVSIPSNIAEGYGRTSTGEYKQFLGHARGSLWEIGTQILIAQKLNYLNDEEASDLLKLATETGRILHGLLSSLKK
ncbi:MAG TPA: four helix bundle protein [Desulfobacterales bacterium]|nr:four helix bundle protein [Desulfobacterales bacterium]